MDAFLERWKFEILSSTTVVWELNSLSPESGMHKLFLYVGHLHYNKVTLELLPVMTQSNLEWDELCTLSLGILRFRE